MSANAFASYTRSTAFSLSLSARMIDRILIIDKARDLATRYDWWSPAGLSGRWDHYRTTDRSLESRGLLAPEDGTCGARLTRAGELMAALLIEAEFQAGRFPFDMTVPPHPDDCDEFGHRPFARLVYSPDATSGRPGRGGMVRAEPIDLPPDRRLKLWQPGDELYWDNYDRSEVEALMAVAR